MAITNKLLQQVDLPVWEWMRFAPGATTSLTALTTARDGSSRFLYYFFGTQLFRYDTAGDSWQTLSIGGGTVTALAAQYVKNKGSRGYILSVPTSTSLQLPSIGTDVTGYMIKIISGTGQGQIRTITGVGPEITHDSGVATTASINLVTDTTKRWKNNQWEGYGVKIVFNTGFSQYREVIYNDTNTVTVFDANYDGRIFNMTPFNANAPYGTPNATAGSQANFTIVSQVVTVDSPWGVTPDSTSVFEIMSDGIWLLTSFATGVFFLYFYYDILTDRWVTKLTPSGLFGAALGTDFSLLPTTDTFGNLPLIGSGTTSTITSATTQSITDSALSLTSGNLIGSNLRVVTSGGTVQERRIISNTNNTIVVSSKFNPTPLSGQTYSVTAEDAVHLVGNARAEMLKYYPEPSLWSRSNILDWGIPYNLALYRPSRSNYGFGVSTANRVTNGITAVSPTPTAAGSGYIVGDILTVTTGGSLGRVYVEQVSITGAVLAVSLFTCGSGYSVGTGRVTTGGAGAGCTVNITSVGTIGVFTTTINADIALGDVLTFSGATEAAWNTSYTILGIQSLTVYEAIITATNNAIANYTLATNLLYDPTKNWIFDEHAGKILGIQSNGLTGVVTYRKIIGNSPTTISFIGGVAPTNGNSRYFIADLEAFGDDETYLADNQLSYGYATSGTTESITDSTKNWFPSVWTNGRVTVNDDTGYSVEEIITSNTNNTLNLGRIVAVGAGTVNTISYSDTEGVTWVGNGITTFATAGNGVAWSGVRFVAVGQGTNSVAYSNDGITWINTASGAGNFSTAGNGICWNGTRFVAVGEGTNSVMHSPDGITWTVVALGATSFTTRGNAIAYNNLLHVAMGEGTNTIATSIDGNTWVAGGSTTFTTSGRAVCWNGTIWVAGGSGTNTVARSTNGTSWTASTTPTNFTSVNGLAWNGTRFVAVGTVSSGTNTIAHSTDGITWTVPTTGIFTQGLSVAWNGVNFIATGVANTNTIAYSTDGITWVAATTSSLFSTSGKGVASTSPFVSMTPNIGIIYNNRCRYKIQDTTGMAQGTQSTTTLQDLTKRWKVNQWAGKRLVMTSGTGVGQELTIASNTLNTLTFATATAPDVSTTYSILGKPVVGAGIQLLWNFGTSVSADKGRLFFLPRGGGSHTFDVYDIRTNRWKYGQYLYGAGELLTTGTMYCYDGVDRIYFQSNATGRIMYYDIAKNYIYPFATIPYGMGTAILGNRMEIVKTPDGLSYLYIMRHSATEMWRCLLFW
jgi:hypothetical protein